MKTEPFFEQYAALIKKVDTQIETLQKAQTQHIVCKKGCAACCMNFGILPVEYYAISNAISANNNELKSLSKDEDCKFLQQNICSIYAHRPIICRTQGLANVYFNSETEVWELSLCEQNFTALNDDFFTEENCLNMDEINQELAEINNRFLNANSEIAYLQNSLIDVNTL